jgi:rare lipoprotein A
MSAVIIIALILINPISYVHQTTLFAQSSESYAEAYTESGIASWYGPGFNGRKTASGERFNTNDLTAAHKTLPFNTLLKVTNVENGKYTVVRVNDRGPYAHGRIIDLSYAAKNELEMGGLAKVEIEIISPEDVLSEKTSANYTLNSNLFEDVIPSKARIFVELDKNISESNDFTQGNFKDVLSTFKRVDILVTEGKSVDALPTFGHFTLHQKDKKYFEVFDLKTILSGYMLEIQNVNGGMDVDELIGKIESANLNTVFLVKIAEKDSANLKIFVGNYKSEDESLYDKNTLENLKIDVRLVKI